MAPPDLLKTNSARQLGAAIKKSVQRLPWLKNRPALQDDDPTVLLQVGRSAWHLDRAMRTELWLSALQKPHLLTVMEAYDSYRAKPITQEASNDIEKDIARAYPTHRRFATEEGKTSLRNVLRAYAAYDPEVAYCQGMHFICGLLLMFLPTEAYAFGGLVVLMEDRGMRKTFSRSLSHLEVQLWQLGKLMPPKLNLHLESLGVVPFTYASPWFMSAFSAEFPVPFSSRIMDVLLGDQCEFPLLRVAVAIMEASERRLRSMNDFEQTVTFLKNDVPSWDLTTLHDLLTEAFDRTWSHRQLSILNSTEGVETVTQAMDRVLNLQEQNDEDEPENCDEADDRLPTRESFESADVPKCVPLIPPPPSCHASVSLAASFAGGGLCAMASEPPPSTQPISQSPALLSAAQRAAYRRHETECSGTNTTSSDSDTAATTDGEEAEQEQPRRQQAGAVLGTGQQALELQHARLSANGQLPPLDSPAWCIPGVHKVTGPSPIVREFQRNHPPEELLRGQFKTVFGACHANPCGLQRAPLPEEQQPADEQAEDSQEIVGSPDEEWGEFAAAAVAARHVRHVTRVPPGATCPEAQCHQASLASSAHQDNGHAPGQRASQRRIQGHLSRSLTRVPEDGATTGTTPPQDNAAMSLARAEEVDGDGTAHQLLPMMQSEGGVLPRRQQWGAASDPLGDTLCQSLSRHASVAAVQAVLDDAFSGLSAPSAPAALPAAAQQELSALSAAPAVASAAPEAPATSVVEEARDRWRTEGERLRDELLEPEATAVSLSPLMTASEQGAAIDRLFAATSEPLQHSASHVATASSSAASVPAGAVAHDAVEQQAYSSGSGMPACASVPAFVLDAAPQQPSAESDAAAIAQVVAAMGAAPAPVPLMPPPPPPAAVLRAYQVDVGHRRGDSATDVGCDILRTLTQVDSGNAMAGYSGNAPTHVLCETMFVDSPGCKEKRALCRCGNEDASISPGSASASASRRTTRLGDEELPAAAAVPAAADSASAATQPAAEAAACGGSCDKDTFNPEFPPLESVFSGKNQPHSAEASGDVVTDAEEGNEDKQQQHQEVDDEDFMRRPVLCVDGIPIFNPTLFMERNPPEDIFSPSSLSAAQQPSIFKDTSQGGSSKGVSASPSRRTSVDHPSAVEARTGQQQQSPFVAAPAAVPQSVSQPGTDPAAVGGQLLSTSDSPQSISSPGDYPCDAAADANARKPALPLSSLRQDALGCDALAATASSPPRLVTSSLGTSTHVSPGIETPASAASERPASMWKALTAASASTSAVNTGACTRPALSAGGSFNGNSVAAATAAIVGSYLSGERMVSTAHLLQGPLGTMGSSGGTPRSPPSPFADGAPANACAAPRCTSLMPPPLGRPPLAPVGSRGAASSGGGAPPAHSVSAFAMSLQADPDHCTPADVVACWPPKTPPGGARPHPPPWASSTHSSARCISGSEGGLGAGLQPPLLSASGDSGSIAAASAAALLLQPHRQASDEMPEEVQAQLEGFDELANRAASADAQALPALAPPPVPGGGALRSGNTSHGSASGVVSPVYTAGDLSGSSAAASGGCTTPEVCVAGGPSGLPRGLSLHTDDLDDLVVVSKSALHA